jgi:hypothetical protein
MPNMTKIEDIDGNILSKKDIKKGMIIIITWDNGRKCIYEIKKDYNPNEDFHKILGKKIILK